MDLERFMKRLKMFIIFTSIGLLKWNCSLDATTLKLSKLTYYPTL